MEETIDRNLELTNKINDSIRLSGKWTHTFPAGETITVTYNLDKERYEIDGWGGSMWNTRIANGNPDDIGRFVRWAIFNRAWYDRREADLANLANYPSCDKNALAEYHVAIDYADGRIVYRREDEDVCFDFNYISEVGEQLGIDEFCDVVFDEDDEDDEDDDLDYLEEVIDNTATIQFNDDGSFRTAFDDGYDEHDYQELIKQWENENKPSIKEETTMIKTNADEKKITKGQAKALEQLTGHLKDILLKALPGSTIELEQIDFDFCPHCALELIEKYGVDEAFIRGLDGDLTFRVGSEKTPYQFFSMEKLAGVHQIGCQMEE